MEKTTKETYEVIKKACENAKGRVVSMSSADLLAAFEYLEQPKQAPKKIES